ncbi:MAG: hypothetical protein IH989_01155 [Planctomycetes bacterium]|nr:hypothetical protein [Planctomycetota bacterium]
MRELSSTEFVLASCQATAFTTDADLSVSKAMKDFYPLVASLFDGEPIVLPAIPEGAPIEIPRVILDSSTHEWRCELSPARANLYWRKTDSTVKPIELTEFFEKSVEILIQYTERLASRVGRLAALVTRFAEHETPGVFLARHFCKERWDEAPLNRPENFELHAHKTFCLADEFTVNSWARSKSGRLSKETDRRPVVLFEQDLNTLAEDANSRSFGEADTRRFFGNVTTELDTILHLYFPDVSGTRSSRA